MLFDILPSKPNYLDPVASGAIIQVLLAILLGVSLFIRAFWRKINAFLGQIKGKFSKQKEVPNTLDPNSKVNKF